MNENVDTPENDYDEMNDDPPEYDAAANDDENAVSDDCCDMNEWNNDHESFANIIEQFMSIKTSIFYQIIW